MARNRLNPWPPVADLFSALTVVSLAALIIVAIGAVKLTQPEIRERDAALELAKTFKEKFSRQADSSVSEAPCEDRPNEQCIHIGFRFKTDSYELSPDGEKEAQTACEMYENAVHQVVRESNGKLQLNDFDLLIEGHTDYRVPLIGSERDRFLYNWTLSSGRAAQVLYEFKNCGVSTETGYNISSVGLADSRPLCRDPNPSPECLEQNRRTTMRIRVEVPSLRACY